MTNLSRRFSFQLIIMVQSSSDTTFFIWFSWCLSRATSLGNSSAQIQQVLGSLCFGCLSSSLSWQLCTSCTDSTLCVFWCEFFERGFALRYVRALLLVCETSLSWRLQLPRVGKRFPQYWHAKVFSPRVWTNMCLFKSSSKVKHLPHCLHLALSTLSFFRCCLRVCPFRPRCSSFRCRFASFGCSTPVFERGFALRYVRASLLVCETSHDGYNYFAWGNLFHSTGTQKSSHLVCEPTCVCSSLPARWNICHTVCIWVCPLCPFFDAVHVLAN